MLDLTLILQPIPSVFGYFASSRGSIFAPDGTKIYPSDGNKYLRLCIEGKSHYVHVLVCEAFHGDRPSKIHQAAHGDGDRSNNSADNLRWATPAENHDDQIRHGTRPVGSKNARAQISESEATEIRAFYAASMGPKYVRRGVRESLARRFGVKIGVIKDIVGGRSWKHVVSNAPFLPPPDDEEASQ